MITIGRSLSIPASTPRVPTDDPKPRRRIPMKMETTSSSSGSVSTSPNATSNLVLASSSTGRLGSVLSIRVLSGFVALIHTFLFLLLAPFYPRREGKKQHERVRVPGVVRRRERDARVRRALAIRRLKSDKDEEGIGMEGKASVRDFSLFLTERGDTLFTQSWTPFAVPIRGLVVMMHGLNEHSSRYNRFAKQLNAEGFKVYGMDWIGHGGSDELHGYVPSLDYAVNDLKAFLKEVLVKNPGLPCFCFGHSTGGAIILKAVLDPKIKELLAGVVVTSPALRVWPSHPLVLVLAPIFSFLAPKYQFSDEDKRGNPVSRDPEALLVKYSDPLVFTGSIRVRTGTEILRITSHLQQNLEKIDIPFLVLHGTADTVTDPKASQKLYDESPSSDKSISLYEGYLHDLLFEPERDDIAQHIIDWLSSRVR